ncbi:hypothetical protein HanOQP8_Chr14g0523641 [Helianthus annuus]|nr:hypothetical protein HanOQP8_Chr14g0523641 [Helianthus annuus]
MLQAEEDERLRLYLVYGYLAICSCAVDSRKTRGAHALIGLFAESYAPYVQGLMQNYMEPGVSLEAASLVLWGRGKAVYILPSSDRTLALILVGFTEYDDDVTCATFFFFIFLTIHLTFFYFLFT